MEGGPRLILMTGESAAEEHSVLFDAVLPKPFSSEMVAAVIGPLLPEE